VREAAARLALYGQDWPTLEGMFAPQAQGIDSLHIDPVFWVDGAAIEWQRARCMKAYVMERRDDLHARQLDELEDAFRSVLSLRTVGAGTFYIVTDSPRPGVVWPSNCGSRLCRARSSSPTLGASHAQPFRAVESQLHNIPVSASIFFTLERRLCLRSGTVSPDAFFSPGGVTNSFQAHWRIGMGSPTWPEAF
jgi:hypothetical protein